MSSGGLELVTLRMTLATLNPAKAVRLRFLCNGLSVQFREFAGPQPIIHETSPTHLGNAVAKAVGWSRALGGVSLASDGGLIIPALGTGWESTLTHRATGESVAEAERARRLLARMGHLRGAQREAYWAEAIALARDGVLLCAWEADGMLGRIGEFFKANPAGPQGFWADGLWETASGHKRWELSESDRGLSADPWVQLFAPVNSFLAQMV